MAEVGVDLSDHRSEPLSDYRDHGVDVIVTMCTEIDAGCCIEHVPGAEVVHAAVPGPASRRRADEAQGILGVEPLAYYRQARDHIRDVIAGLPQLLVDRGIACERDGAYARRA